MRNVAKCLVTTSLVTFAAFAAMQAKAADVEATSAVDTVTVYPDGASVTRAITVDVPAGDNTLVIRDFPGGRGQMAAANKDETVRLGFGADDKVKIERAVVKRNEGSTGLIVTSKTDERAFKTVIRNGHDFPIRIAIEDQLPVSENEDILVDMLPSTTPPTAANLRDRRGVLEWAFEAKPAEVRDIAFAWRVRWPKDKGVVMVPAG
jgi:hypothetical protein